ncbi:hypothetical protein TTHNP3_00046 (plasmid) [Thermus thermophilus]|uniref:Uncharacterized protein n=1 Tax=Thermus thermophilus TaxID=274 RepID=A0A3P4AX06_THETH|nr:hypothetical protein [Thermus thermophilus]VCU54533.1 hypothetical protein TTHNP3_00046 [Thermus thermophilus]
MNYSAYACALLGKKALERERVLELLEEVPDLPERAEVYLADGHLFLELAEPREEEVWALAATLEAFVLEAGPDSGGPGWAGTKEGSVELLPQNLPLLARMYEAWRRENEPVGEGDLEVFLALLREAEEEVA